MIQAIRRLFIGRDDTFAVQNDDGSYTRVEKPLTDEIILKHLSGEITIGVYQLDLNSNIKWICWDFDENKADALKVYEYLKNHERYGKACVLEDTGGRGAHVWLFFNPMIPGYVGKFIGNEIAEKLGVKCEVFPKQEKVNLDGFGSLVRLPFGVHRKYGRRSIILDPSSIDEVEPVAIPQDVIMEIEELIKHKGEMEEMKKVIPAGLIPWWVECKAFDRIIYGNIEEGTRNECGFWIARLLRNSGFPSWMTEEVLQCWNRHLKCRSLPEREIHTIVKSVYSKGYSVGKLSLKKTPETSVYCEGCVKPVCSEKKTRKKNEKKPKLIKPYGVL